MRGIEKQKQPLARQAAVYLKKGAAVGDGEIISWENLRDADVGKKFLLTGVRKSGTMNVENQRSERR
jgi:hypothetical protein